MRDDKFGDLPHSHPKTLQVKLVRPATGSTLTLTVPSTDLTESFYETILAAFSGWELKDTY